MIDDPAAMPKVGLLYASVEGFLDLPVVGRYLVPPVRADGHAGKPSRPPAGAAAPVRPAGATA